jgi:hypothetical protein
MSHITYEWKEPELLIMVDKRLAAVVSFRKKPDESGFAIIVNEHLVACSSSNLLQSDKQTMIVGGLHEDNVFIDEFSEKQESQEEKEISPTNKEE